MRVSSAIPIAALSFLALGIGGYLAWWYSGRSEPVERELFRGVRHVRVVLNEPRRIVANLLILDLKTKSIDFQVTAPDPDITPKLKAATVGQFLERTGAQVALNANFFHPFHSKSPWDFYPRAGDPVAVLGIAACAGVTYSTQAWAGATIYFQQDNRVQIGGTVSNVWNAIAGDQWLVRGGTNLAKADAFAVYPRAAVGLNEAGDELILAVADGKQPGFSEGMTLPELAELLKSRGAHDAVNLDGGGSVTLVAADSSGKPVVLNSPIHTRIPGRQRPVGNQLGIRVKH
ncbi:MAG: phosphodiester glycosidase family protein [Limisphaerales bacterium]